ncbi:MAG: hypothetical protein ABW136_09090 [Steroidobacteraceae bacterium]
MSGGERSPVSTRAWLVFWLVAAASYANYYAFDPIGPVADCSSINWGSATRRSGC